MDSTAAPSSGYVPPEKQRQFFGHPVGLYILFFTEMWERFSYYGMRGLLKGYIAYALFSTAGRALQPPGGTEYPKEAPTNPHDVLGFPIFHSIYPDSSVQDFGSHLYGLYTALVYATPVIGGYLADKYFGQRKTVMVGAIIMAIGHFVMASQQLFFLALGLLIIGNGAFKPNISTQVGDLYPPGDARRDGAFTIFYMGINLGAFLCNFVCGFLATTWGWDYGFGAAGVGMVIGLFVYLLGQRYLAPEKPRAAEAKVATAEGSGPLTADEWRRVGALCVLCLLNVAFWAVYEQQGNTMETWSETQTNWTFFGHSLPPSLFQSFNPFMIFVFAPVLDMYWRWQNRRGTEPTSVAKMAIGATVLGLSFIVMAVGAHIVGNGVGSLAWPFFCTLILTIGELYLSPVGLSLVTKVSPARIVSMMMGIWLASSFAGNYLSGVIGTYYDDMSKTAFFLMLSVIGVATGALMWAFNAPIKRAMGSHAV
jgi:POT family proton-dependent oligopeptide transporter